MANLLYGPWQFFLLHHGKIIIFWTMPNLFSQCQIFEGWQTLLSNYGKFILLDHGKFTFLHYGKCTLWTMAILFVATLQIYFFGP